MRGTKRKVVKAGPVDQFGRIPDRVYQDKPQYSGCSHWRLFSGRYRGTHRRHKVDYTPVTGDTIDLQRFAEIGKRCVGADVRRRNVRASGFTASERTVGHTIDNLFAENKDHRIIIATFASNVDRVQQIINTAYKYGRKVVVEGRSMVSLR